MLNLLLSSCCIKIETYWNVNIEQTMIRKTMMNIKIETYWNVNVPLPVLLKMLPVIKIETYWNVNFITKL